MSTIIPIVTYCQSCDSLSFILTAPHSFILLFASYYSRYVDPESFQGLTSLRHLLLNNNALIVLECALFLPLSRLCCLDLSNNNLVNVSAPLAGLDRLTHLKICQVPSGKFQPMSKLSYLVMVGCRLKSVKPRFIQHLTDLIYLDLSKNDMIQIPSYAFTTSARLFEIKLESNKIINISRLAFHGLTRLHYIWLGKNQLHCTFPLETPTLMQVELQANQVCSPIWIYIYLLDAPTGDVWDEVV